MTIRFTQQTRSLSERVMVLTFKVKSIFVATEKGTSTRSRLTKGPWKKARFVSSLWVASTHECASKVKPELNGFHFRNTVAAM